MIARLLILTVAAGALVGCKTTESGSVAGGESKVFEAPEYAVRGRTQYDQDWIDGNIEAGVAAFGWPRPKPRPPELDAVPLPAPRPVATKKKPSLVQRIKARVTGAPPAPFTHAAPMPALAVPAAPVAPPPAPIDPVDELLGLGQ